MCPLTRWHPVFQPFMFVNTDLMGAAFVEQKNYRANTTLSFSHISSKSKHASSSHSIQNAAEADLVCEIYNILTQFFLASLECVVPAANPQSRLKGLLDIETLKTML